LDKIAIVLRNDAGTILYSSSWNGIRTVLQTTAGGNIQVH